MTRRPEGSDPGTNAPHRHLLHLFVTPEEQASVAARFVSDGLARGERCAYIGPAASRAMVAAALATRGVDPAAHGERGALALLDDAETYLVDGCFEPGRTLAALEAFGRASSSRGYGGSRIASDAGLALSGARGTERLLEYEAAVDGVLAAGGSTALCQYDRHRFPARVLLGVLKLHRFVLRGERVLANFYASGPSSASPEDELDEVLGALEHRDLHRHLLENARDVVFRLRLGPPPAYEYVSPAVKALTGRPPEDYYRDPELPRRLVHPDDRAKLARALESFATEPRLRWVHDDGKVVHTDLRVVVVHDGEGRPIALEGIGRDVSEQVAMEEALRESEQRLRVVLDTAGHALWEWDASGAWNGDPDRLLGYARGEIPPTLEWWRRLVHRDDLPRSVREFEEHARGETPHLSSEYRALARDGGWRWLLSRGRTVARNAAGHATRMVGTITDVTVEHGLHAQAIAADRLASVGTLAAGIAHEINNPLAAVWANLEVISDDLAQVERAPAASGDTLASSRAALTDAIQAAARVRDVVQSLHHFARPPRERTDAVDVCAELEAAIELARDEISRRARLVVEVPPALPKVAAVPYELGQAFVGLLLNAAHAIPEGRTGPHEVRVRARAEGGEIRVDVSDTGAGISEENLRRIFEPFFTTKRAGSGRGLGLSVCHSIVSGAGGRVEVESAEGRGSVFSVFLPVAVASGSPKA